MSCKPDTKTTVAMYKLYLSGHSCGQVAKAFGLSRQTVYKRFLRRGLCMRKPAKPLPFVLFDGHKYTRRVGGYYAKTNGKRGFLHRDVWEKAKGPIPPSHDIHHIDGDRSNNRLSNLELISKAEHTRRYGHRGNQHTK